MLDAYSQTGLVLEVELHPVDLDPVIANVPMGPMIHNHFP